MQAAAKSRNSKPIERKQAAKAGTPAVHQPQALREVATSESKEATDREIIDRTVQRLSPGRVVQFLARVVSKFEAQQKKIEKQKKEIDDWRTIGTVFERDGFPRLCFCISWVCMIA